MKVFAALAALATVASAEIGYWKLYCGDSVSHPPMNPRTTILTLSLPVLNRHSHQPRRHRDQRHQYLHLSRRHIRLLLPWSWRKLSQRVPLRAFGKHHLRSVHKPRLEWWGVHRCRELGVLWDLLLSLSEDDSKVDTEVSWGGKKRMLGCT